jgi:hypothetical protein
MQKQILSLININTVPFSSYVAEKIMLSLVSLVDGGLLMIDTSGSQQKTALYKLEFLIDYSWNEYNRFKNWYRPFLLGKTGTVAVEAITRWNFCEDVNNARACEPVLRRSPDELGYGIAVTAIHEIGHLFGLNDKASYTGADDSGHTGDERNYMFINTLHREYLPLLKDYQRTRKRPIAENDTLSGIAERIGFHPPFATWKNLYDFTGRDGTRNSELLKSHNPDKIFPGEEIWIPDFSLRRTVMRAWEIARKEFTKTQVDTMMKWIKAGRTLVP